MLGHAFAVESGPVQDRDSITRKRDKAAYWLAVAARAWREVNPRGDKRKIQNWRRLTVEDFDKQVWYFSR